MMGLVNPKHGRWNFTVAYSICGWVLIIVGATRVVLPAVYAYAALGRPMAMTAEVLWPSLIMIAAGAILIVWGRRTRGLAK